MNDQNHNVPQKQKPKEIKKTPQKSQKTSVAAGSKKTSKKTKTEKTEPIIGLAQNPEVMTIEKSRPLYVLWQSKLTLNELKLLDAYLARINAHDDSKRTVIYDLGDIEKILGIKRILKTELEQNLKNLMMPLEIADPDDDNKIELINLFEEAVAIKDEQHGGLWTVSLTCGSKARKYIFNIDHTGYLQYRLSCVRTLRSRYSYIMFNYLCDHQRFAHQWDVDLNQLKQILRCDDTPAYSEYRRFNAKVLQLTQHELADKSQCYFNYEPIKRRNKVVAIHFEIISMLAPASNPNITDGSQGDSKNLNLLLTAENSEEMNKEKYKDTNVAFIATACNNEFSDKQMQSLISLVATIPPAYLPSGGTDMLVVDQQQYLRERYMRLQKAAEKRTIKDRYKYMRQILRNDIKQIQATYSSEDETESETTPAAEATADEDEQKYCTWADVKYGNMDGRLSQAK